MEKRLVNLTVFETAMACACTLSFMFFIVFLRQTCADSTPLLRVVDFSQSRQVASTANYISQKTQRLRHTKS
jgi:hypothetical protein